MKLFKQLEALFTKADKTEVRYQEALEKKQEELIQLQAVLQEKHLIQKELHKETLLGTISEETFESEKKKHEALQKKVQELQKEMKLIEVYQNEDIKTLLEELEAEKNKVYKNKQKELDKMKLELLEAKSVYLQKMIEAREKYNELVAPDRKLDALKIKLGLKNMSYVSGSFEALNQYSIQNGGYELLRLEQKEIYDALEYGKAPESLNKLITEAKEKGILE